MNGLPYYKAYPRDFFEGTIGMSLELKGAYRVLLDLIYMQAGRLPDDPKYIAGMLGCSVRAWNKHRSELIAMGKIVADLGVISNFRADKELETLRSLQDKQRENGSKGGKVKGLRQALAKPKPSHTEPEPDKEEREDLDLGHSVPEVTETEPPASSQKRPAKVTRIDPAEGFEAWWQIVPRKVAKGAARKAYATALRKADAATLFAAMRDYSASRQGQDPQFTAHPASWLNAERWTDNAAPPTPISQQSPQLSAQIARWQRLASGGQS